MKKQQFAVSGKHPVSFGNPTPRELNNMVAYHESRHTDDESDTIQIVMLSDDFVQEIERNGTRRSILHDIGFDLNKDSAPIDHIPIDLGKGYCTFDRTIVQDKDGFSRPKGYTINKGKSKGHARPNAACGGRNKLISHAKKKPVPGRRQGFAPGGCR